MTPPAIALLLREPPLVVLPSLAKAVGLNEALLLQQIHYRSIDRSSDGWVQRTRSEWADDFPFWHPDTIKRALASLRDQGLVEAEYVTTISGREPRYRVLYDAVDALGGSGQIAPMGRGKQPRGVGANCPEVETFKGREANCGEEQVSSLTTPAPKKTTASQSSSSSSRLAARRDSGDVVGLCVRLAGRMRINDERAKVAPDSIAWRDPMRLLLDRDRRTIEDVERVIDWCQTDEFWRSNILSPAALRRQFPRLLLAMRRDDGATGPAARPGGKPGGPHDADERARALRERAGSEHDLIEGTAEEIA